VYDVQCTFIVRIDDLPPGAGGQILIGVTQGCFGCKEKYLNQL